MTLVGIVQTNAFFLAIISNALFICLSFFTRTRNFGKWQKLMIIYSGYQMVYTVIEFIVLPEMYMKGPSMMMFSNGIIQNYPSLAYILIPIYCCTFATTLCLLSCQFMYRYSIICGGRRIEKFTDNIFTSSAVFTITFSVAWAAVVATFMQSSLEKQLHYGDDIAYYFNKDIFKIVAYYILFKSRDTAGNTFWNLDQLLAIMLLFLIMFFLFSIITLCGVLSYVKFHENKHTYSRTTRDLHQQYFMVLKLQTAIPLITMYLPVGTFFVFPLFEIEIGAFINFTGAAVAIFPAIDPIVSILALRQYRRAVLSLFGRKSSRISSNGSTKKSISKF